MEDELNQGAVDAMSAALSGEQPTTETPTDVSTDESKNAGAETGDGEGGAAAAEGAETGDAAASDADKAAEEAAKKANDEAGEGAAAGDPPAGHERDPKTGRFVKKAAAAPSTPDKGTKPEIDPKTGQPKAAAPKKADHVNDPIPEDIKGRTRERMEGLVATTKELTTKLSGAEAELTEARQVLDMIEATGAPPEAFARHLNVLALMHSPKLEDKQAVLKYFRTAATSLAKDLGETPPGEDPLTAHPDLLEDVQNGELKRERAIELAEARNRAKASERINADNRQRINAETEAEQQRERTRAALNTLSAELRKRDGEEVYARKHAVLVPFIKRIHSTLAPDKVVEAVRKAYDELALGAAAPKSEQRRVGGNAGAEPTKPATPAQPLRGNNGAGAGGGKAPQNVMEALDFGLEQEAATRGIAR